MWAPPSDTMKAIAAVDVKTKLEFSGGTEKPVTTAGLKQSVADPSKFQLDKETLGRFGIGSASTTTPNYLTPGELDETQWNGVIQNCNVMYGWKFDLETLSVKRAPRQAFQLRKDPNMH